MSQNQIIGVFSEQVDPETDVTCSFHRISSFYVNKEGNVTQATLRSYVSQKSWENGKAPVGMLGINVQLNAVPPYNEPTESFIYQHLSEAVEPVTQQPSVLHQSKLVEVAVEAPAV